MRSKTHQVSIHQSHQSVISETTRVNTSITSISHIRPPHPTFLTVQTNLLFVEFQKPPGLNTSTKQGLSGQSAATSPKNFIAPKKSTDLEVTISSQQLQEQPNSFVVSQSMQLVPSLNLNKLTPNATVVASDTHGEAG